VNLGRYQLIWWPRWKLFFLRRRYVCYDWIIYVWPLELRCFERTG
jgi:hypothetical protein